MAMPKNELRSDMESAWNTYLNALEKSLQTIEGDIAQASEMAEVCTSEWCSAIEHYLDDIANALFSISEPRWADRSSSDRIKKLRRRVHELYADYREVYRSVSA
jgi:hypothetical protein